MSCYFCDEIEKINSGHNKAFLAELPETYVLLKSSKLFPGYCLVIAKQHFEQLPELPTEKQLRIFADVSRVAGVIYSQLKPERINYECLGNLVRHIHWHVIPRYKNDPYPNQPIWEINKDQRAEELGESELKNLRAQLALI